MIISLSLWPRRRRPNTTGSRTAPQSFLSDSQWNLIADLLADRPPAACGGRPRVPPRACLEGIIWVLTSGARWKDLPERYPSPCTCWRRLRQWTDDGRFLAAWKRLLGKLQRLKGINWEEAIGDGSFSRAKKGVPTLVTVVKVTAPRSC
jgi:transposase